MTTRTPKQQDRRSARSVTIANAELGPEQAEKAIRPLLVEQDDPVQVTVGDADVPDEYVDALFGSLMESAMATGGRRLAAEWKSRLQVLGSAGDRAQHAMARTIDLDLRFGMLAPPLAAQAGCHTEVLAHQQQDADCIARLAVRGIATEGEVRKMRQRLVKHIVKAVVEDTQPQTLGVNRKHPGNTGADAHRKHAVAPPRARITPNDA